MLAHSQLCTEIHKRLNQNFIMVSFRPAGRLGNFLFSTAALISYAKKNRLDFCVPARTNDHYWNPVYLQHLTSPRWRYNDRHAVILNEETGYRYADLAFQEEWRYRQIEMRGYFQNPLYFEHDREDILKTFGYHWELNKGFVSVHVRRGDYLTLTDKHPAVTVEWYLEAMSMFEGYQFIFFSDDIQWCKDTFAHRPDCSFHSGSEVEDLVALSHCEHHINSASTFSWMGAWMNRNGEKRVVLPKQWLMPSHSNQWTEEIVPKTWTRI